MATQDIHAVTGAFGYSGKYIASRLLREGKTVRTLTNSPDRANPFGSQVQVFPFNFDDKARMITSLLGVSVLYNTYWVRFSKAGFHHSSAVENTIKLFEAAKEAGVRRVVHTSITNPTEDSPFEYFRGKAILERALIESGLSYSILRPAVLFGKEDILINNIAWVLRKLPIFGVFGDGLYRLQPIYVDDFASLAVKHGSETSNRIIDVIGPETFTYRGLVEQIGKIIGKRRPLVSIPPVVGYLVGLLLGFLMGDVFITREEIAGLMADLLYTESTPVGTTQFTQWATSNASILGIRYASELARRRDHSSSYDRQ
ncbi:MAG: NAD(P)H-binding protein [Anaerolineales bacterium]|nr:NAD(P)H-binding protein [Anaerolineales bacterium]